MERGENEDLDDNSDTYSDLDEEQILSLIFKEDEVKTKTKIKKSSSTVRPMKKSNVLYLGHIPHGFFEHEIKSFLTQFGNVRKVRVSRSQKTGKSRGYGFIQMENKEVADIVQKTLHGYILLGRSLVCGFVPEEHVHEKMFKGGLTPFSKTIKDHSETRKKRVLRHLKKTSDGADSEPSSKRIKRLHKADKRRREKLAKKGFNYEFKGYDE